RHWAQAALQYLAEEVLEPGVLGISENVGGGALLQQLAVCHEEDPAAHLPGKAHLVGDHHHSHALLGQLLHDLQHLAHHLRVQGGGGLVKEHNLRLHHQCPDNGNPLLLAAGELDGIGAGTVLQA
ncbi:Transposase and inactivated derivatives, partial [Dysosmobacter welbionis]